MIAMKITLLGTGTSFPDPERVQSGILIETNDRTILLDIGSGVLQRLTHLKYDLTKIDAVFISHFHIDHCSDFLTLCQSLWLAGYDRSLQVYAPPNIREWSRGLRDIAFPYLLEKIGVEIHSLRENDLVYLDSLSVATCPTLHGTMQTRAFKVEEAGFKFVFSSDTAPSADVISLAKDADILVHECNWLDGNHPEGVHTSPSELAHVVEAANPSMIVLNHVSPEVVANSKKVIDTIQRRTKATVTMGEDFSVFSN
ncbi:MAG: MBL fold metallo-hydrolase [Candidatus Thorarchaeota archaeon]|nr:MBL fold metallo-hydrolase [Candidatus Thorarchaeota archaeon]